MRPGKMIREVLKTFLKKPVTILYPKEKIDMPEHFRGKLKFYPQECIGCQMCVRDCPTGAIKIIKVAEKQFEAHIDLAKCIYCAQCVDVCPKKALEATKDVELAALDLKSLKVVFHGELPKPPQESAP